jgi:hypothetical protein
MTIDTNGCSPPFAGAVFPAPGVRRLLGERELWVEGGDGDIVQRLVVSDELRF